MPSSKVRLAALTLLTASALSCGPLSAQTAPGAGAAESAIESAKGTGQASAEAAPANSGMTAELFFVLLLAEVNLRNGEIGAGHALLLEAARKSNDTRLYQRAIETSQSGDAALQTAKAWRQAQPASRTANRMVLQLLIALNRLGESQEALKATLAQSPAAELPLEIAAIPRFYQQATDRKLAASVVEQALADLVKTGTPPAQSAPAWVSIGRMRAAADDLPGALDAAQRAMGADAGNSGSALLAMELMGRKQANAEPLVRKFMAGDNASPEVRMAYARVLVELRRYADALKQLQILSREKPAFAEAWLVQGVLQMQQMQPAEAEASLRKYLELVGQASTAKDADGDDRKPGQTQAYLSLAQIAEERNDLAAAQTWLDKIVGEDSTVNVQNRRASLLARQGKLEQGLKLLEALPEGENAEARMKLMAQVNLLRENRENRRAYTLLQQGGERFGNDADLLYEQAMLAEKLGELAEMERLLQKVIAGNPDHYQAYNALGFSLAERNVRLPEAKKLIRKALESAPDDPFIQDSLGWVEFRLGNKTEALRILDLAFRARPDVEIAAHLGEVLWSLGQQARALSVWREGYKLNATSETLQETLKRLRVKL